MSKTRKPAASTVKNKPDKPALATKSLIPFVVATNFNIPAWSAGISFVFFILLLAGIFRHEPWRDEFQALQIVINSHSISGLFYNLRYEGHPGAWYLLLYPLTRLTHDYFYMQLLHILLATLTAFLILRYATFPYWMRVLLIFGYFTFYEFAIISRSYVLGELATVLFCIGWMGWKNKILSDAKLSFTDYLFPALSLVLMANTSSYNLAEALGFCAFAFLWCVMERKIAIAKINYVYAVIGILIILTGAVVSYIQIKPLPDNTVPVYYATGFDLYRVGYALAFILPAYFPVPDFSIINNWNTFFVPITRNPVFGFTAVIVLSLTCLCFQNKRRALLLYATVNLGALAFCYYILREGSRYNGQLWIIFIAALWFYYDTAETRDKPVFNSLQNLSVRAGKIFFPLLLTVQAAMGFYFYFRDLEYPFSNTAEAGKYLQRSGLCQLPLTGVSDFTISALSYFTERPVFVLGRRKFSSFMIYDGYWNSEGLSAPADIFKVADSLLVNSASDSLLVCLPIILHQADGKTPLMEGNLTPLTYLKALGRFNDPSIEGDETFNFYLLTKIKN